MEVEAWRNDEPIDQSEMFWRTLLNILSVKEFRLLPIRGVSFFFFPPAPSANANEAGALGIRTASIETLKKERKENYKMNRAEKEKKNKKK